MFKVGIVMAIEKGIYYEFFNFRLDVENQQLLKNGETVQLTHKAFQILHLLVQNSGQITKKEDIFKELWSDSFVEEANLTQHIYVLRKALGRTPDNQSFIETVPKQGYRFTLRPEQISVIKPVAQTPESQPEMDESSTLNSEFSQTDSEISFSQSTASDQEISDADEIDNFQSLVSRMRLSTLITTGIIFLLLIGISAAAYYYFQAPKQPTISENEDIKSIAVLPFKPIGNDVDSDRLGLGMADAIISRLSNLQRVVVRPTSAVFSYTDQPNIQVVEAGRKLGVDAVLEGTIQSHGKRLRISVQLIRVADGKPLWAESFQENVSDIFSVQDSISAKVATALSINLTQQQEQLLAQRATSSAEAFQAYQQGIYYWNRRSKADLQKAVEYFIRATEYDPNYAYAYAGLADSYSSLGYFGFEDANEMTQKARQAAGRALALNDSLGEAYIALALAEVTVSDFEKARQLLERALILSPYSATARQRYGHVLIFFRKLEEGVRQMRLAQEYDPLSPTNNKSLCTALMYQRNFSEAIRFCEKSVELSPNTPGSRSSLAHAYFHAGRHSEAINQLDLERISGSNYSSTQTSLAYFYAKLGRREEAEKIYEQLKPQLKNDLWLPLTMSPIAYSLGRKAEAFELFKKAVETINTKPEIGTIITYSPTFDEIKADPQFAAIIPL
jgi:DNA-binding winged helix-turn-helix (wHTH) protein/TolB-like protein